MHPLLFKIGDFKVWAYGFFYLLVLILIFILFVVRGRKQGYDLDFLINFMLFEYLVSLVGCRLLFIFLYPEYYQSFSEILQFQKGGFAYYGGMLLGLASGFLYLRFFATAQNDSRGRVSPLAIFDIAMPLMFLGNFLGRVGCFLKGCCWGIICNISHLGIIFPKDSDAYNSHLNHNLIDKDAVSSLPVYPVQIYESIICGILFFYFWSKYGRRRFDGQIMFESILAYALERFFMEFLRGDVSRTLYLSVSQYIGIILIVISSWFLVISRKNYKVKMNNV